MSDHDSMAAWLASRPQAIQETAKTFPPASMHMINDVMYYIVGYTEGGDILVSTTDPTKDYDTAVQSKHVIHVDCLEFVRKAYVDENGGTHELQ